MGLTFAGVFAVQVALVEYDDKGGGDDAQDEGVEEHGLQEDFKMGAASDVLGIEHVAKGDGEEDDADEEDLFEYGPVLILNLGKEARQLLESENADEGHQAVADDFEVGEGARENVEAIGFEDEQEEGDKETDT